MREALADSKRGRSERALALLSSLLLTNNARVGVDEGSLPKGSREAFRRGMERGVRTWREAMPEAPFALSRPREEPDVVVRFVPRIDVTEDVQGMIEAKRELRWDRKGYGYRLRAVLLVREETDRRLLTENEVASVVAHELGHLLGLDDTGRVRELMGPFVPASPARARRTTRSRWSATTASSSARRWTKCATRANRSFRRVQPRPSIPPRPRRCDILSRNRLRRTLPEDRALPDARQNVAPTGRRGSL